MSWRRSRVSEDRTHHVLDDRPMYRERFDEVLPFHEPGLAPVLRDGAAFHLSPTGTPAYAQRYVRTFGFYNGLAAAVAPAGWLHIGPDGVPLYKERHLWTGNYQDGRCAVRYADGSYGHLDHSGSPAYPVRFRYAGDFREGIAVALRADGRHIHIRRDGSLLGSGEWLDLGPFHKGFAAARDERGWTHIDLTGRPAYPERYAALEPFYNGCARVLGRAGAIFVIGEDGRVVTELRAAREP